jgi:DNA-binding MarR family transcriptional regulator
MSALVVNDALEFTALRDLLKLTDGNLAAHIATLEKRGYVKVEKAFVGKRPQTTYRITDRGRTLFEEHLDALEKMIKETRRVQR